METMAFSTLPAEIHLCIAKHCVNHDLINLCLTSKWVNERCSPVLYRHVDLQLDRYPLGHVDDSGLQLLIVRDKKQKQFAHTLLSQPKYCRHVRFLKTSLNDSFLHDNTDLEGDTITGQEVGRAMQLLTHVQSLDLSFRKRSNLATKPTKQLPDNLFQSATSLRLVGHIQYGLANSILNTINPLTLQHLCLDMVQEEHEHRKGQGGIVPEDEGEDGLIISARR